MLAAEPARGRDASELAPNLRRSAYESHIIFYVPEATGVLIVRVLHQRMDFARHGMAEK